MNRTAFAPQRRDHEHDPMGAPPPGPRRARRGGAVTGHVRRFISTRLFPIAGAVLWGVVELIALQRARLAMPARRGPRAPAAGPRA